MHWTETKRRLSILAAGPALLLATACGGGDKGPTGPGGGGSEADFDLVALGQAGLPADAEVEDCTMTRFYGGGLQVRDDGTWQIRLQVHDGNYGDWGYRDEGQIEQDGSTCGSIRRSPGPAIRARSTARRSRSCTTGARTGWRTCSWCSTGDGVARRCSAQRKWVAVVKRF